MGNRLSKIYTRTGDDGYTGLSDGRRIEKDSLRIEAIGTVDELNAAIGRVLVDDGQNSLSKVLADVLLQVQHDLFDLGGELSMPEQSVLEDDQVKGLEQALDAANAELPPLKEFILPGGGRVATDCHLARTICRRAERRLVALSRLEIVNSFSLQYLNRLSDLLFVYCRVFAIQCGQSEVFWRSRRMQD